MSKAIVVNPTSANLAISPLPCIQSRNHGSIVPVIIKNCRLFSYCAHALSQAHIAHSDATEGLRRGIALIRPSRTTLASELKRPSTTAAPNVRPATIPEHPQSELPLPRNCADADPRTKIVALDTHQHRPLFINLQHQLRRKGTVLTETSTASKRSTYGRPLAFDSDPAALTDSALDPTRALALQRLDRRGERKAFS